MALGDPYATVDDLKGYLQIASSTQFDSLCSTVLASASEKVEEHTGRQFNLAASASTRIFSPSYDPRWCEVDEFVLTNDFVLATDPGGTGNFEVTWTAPLDYELFPLNGVVDGQPGWPYSEIHAIAGVWFPLIQFRRMGTVQVTAQWGWPAVPASVHNATLIIAAELFKLKDAPFGTAGTSVFGVMRVRDNPMAANLLAKYVRQPIQGGSGPVPGGGGY